MWETPPLASEADLDLVQGPTTARMQVKTAACTGACKQLRGEATLVDPSKALVASSKARTSDGLLEKIVCDLRGEAVKVT
jgi:hypothetical protein